jgi:hypothetical protein
MMTTEPHIVTLVGGYASMAANFELHLAEWGMEVNQHFEYLPLRVPIKTTLLIVLKSACSHRLSDAAHLVATKRQIPVVVVDHHWTQAEATLRLSGVLDEVRPPVMDTTLGYWAEARIAEVTRQAICLERRSAETEEMLLEQGQALETLQMQFAQQQEALERLRADVIDPRRGMTLTELRRYATYEIGIVGASKIRGGKEALLQRISEQQAQHSCSGEERQRTYGNAQ